MTSNGKRRPPRPAIEVVAPGAGPEEAAAIAAALEQFLHDAAPAPPRAAPPLNPWAKAALAEGVGIGAPTPWGNELSWGERSG